MYTQMQTCAWLYTYLNASQGTFVALQSLNVYHACVFGFVPSVGVFVGLMC